MGRMERALVYVLVDAAANDGDIRPLLPDDHARRVVLLTQAVALCRDQGNNMTGWRRPV